MRPKSWRYFIDESEYGERAHRFQTREDVMEAILSYLDYGFSFVISIYLLIRMENKIEKLTESINNLNKKEK